MARRLGVRRPPGVMWPPIDGYGVEEIASSAVSVQRNGRLAPPTLAGDLGNTAPAVLDAARTALVDGWSLSMWVGVALAGVALLYLVVRGPRPADVAEEDALDGFVALEPVAGQLTAIRSVWRAPVTGAPNTPNSSKHSDGELVSGGSGGRGRGR